MSSKLQSKRSRFYNKQKVKRVWLRSEVYIRHRVEMYFCKSEMNSTFGGKSQISSPKAANTHGDGLFRFDNRTIFGRTDTRMRDNFDSMNSFRHIPKDANEESNYDLDSFISKQIAGRINAKRSILASKPKILNTGNL